MNIKPYKYDKKRLIEGFIKNSHEKCWDKIKARDEVYFVENMSTIFGDLPIPDLNLFKDLFLTRDKKGDSVISIDLKNEIWDLFSVMTRISIRYIHKHRMPIADGAGNFIYTNPNFFSQVDLDYHVKVWNLKLTI